MPVDLTPDNKMTRLREAVSALRDERDRLREQVADLPTLYDELAVREERIAALKAQVEARWIEEVYHAALIQIVEKNGRGAKKVAAEALEQTYS